MNSVKSDCKILVTVLGILLTILEYMYVRMPTVMFYTRVIIARTVDERRQYYCTRLSLDNTDDNIMQRLYISVA